ncbi:MAG: hypothetical protein C4519_04660 [Desulfobacteraceae bacterium]|nr:MAG: hypothetical protein C4519_04660 [Desulfobacteraceae bacterium]
MQPAIGSTALITWAVSSELIQYFKNLRGLLEWLRILLFKKDRRKSRWGIILIFGGCVFDAVLIPWDD